MNKEYKVGELTSKFIYEESQKLYDENKELKQRIDKAKELCKIVLDNEDKNQDLLDHVSGIFKELQGKE